MKKCTLPLLLLGLLTACQADFEPEVAYNKENYTKAFVQAFGTIDPEQTWGFGPKARSRAGVEYISEPDASKMNTQGNLWKNPPMVKEWEKEKVMAYLNSGDVYSLAEPLNITTSYFITHVTTCAKQENVSDGKIYYDVRGDAHQGIVMDQMVVETAEPWTSTSTLDDITTAHDKWYHANNFNSSRNSDNLGNTVCQGGGSYRFAIHSGYDDRWYDKYIIVPGEKIDYRLKDYYYLCFDLEAYKAFPFKTAYNVNFSYKSGEQVQTSSRNDVRLDGIYEHEWGKGADVKPTDAEILEALKATIGDNWESSYPDLTVTSFQLMDGKNAYPDGDKYILGDEIYDDWVIRICANAVPRCHIDEIPVYPYEDPYTERVFVEDLSIAASYNIGNLTDSDWDFNDLVFDVRFAHQSATVDGVKNEISGVQLVLRALGGTLPIYIGDGHGHYTEELHSYFKVDQKTMVNTEAGPNLPPVNISEALKDFEFDSEDASAIKVYIQPHKEELALVELTAEQGQAPCKLCVPSYLAAPQERICITSPYNDFYDYVQAANKVGFKFWEHKDNINNNGINIQNK